MPHFHAHTHAHEPVSAFNTRLGLVLFFLYLPLYAAFVILSAFWPDVFDIVLFGGVNLGIIYGFALIASAFLLALLYSWCCHVPGADAADKLEDTP